jgi:hypothetical protein
MHVSTRTILNFIFETINIRLSKYNILFKYYDCYIYYYHCIIMLRSTQCLYLSPCIIVHLYNMLLLYNHARSLYYVYERDINCDIVVWINCIILFRYINTCSLSSQWLVKWINETIYQLTSSACTYLCEAGTYSS